MLFLLYASKVAQHRHTTEAILQHVTEVFIHAVPVATPTVIIFALAFCVIKLLHRGIHVHKHVKVKLAADVEVVVFDKTGTLTGDVVSMLLSQLQESMSATAS